MTFPRFPHSFYQWLGRLCAMLLTALVATVPVQAQSLAGPYRLAQNNLAYNMLFCDDAALFKARDMTGAPAWQNALFAPTPDAVAVHALADDAMQDSRIRLLADAWLRQHFQKVPPGQLLGVVIEVTSDSGQDTLAAYADGHVRYIDHAEKSALIEPGQDDAGVKAQALLASSAKLLKRSGLWNKKRLPAPLNGKVRMSFLVSDGLHFGEGSFASIAKDGESTQVITDATALLQIAVKYAVPAK